MKRNELKQLIKECITELQMDENFLFPTDEEKKEAWIENVKDHIRSWSSMGYKKPSPDEWHEILQQAKIDKYRGLLGVDKESKTIIYRPSNKIKWSSPTNSFA
jgi:hypothetical protein